jgi:hypothetical protein
MAEPKPLQTLFTYPWDLNDDGLDRALDVIQEDARMNGVSLAVAYHIATYFLPHNPTRKIYFGPDGMLLFVPDGAAWEETKLRPRVSPVVENKDWLPRITEAIKKRGLHFTAWTVYFYNHYLARTFPQAAKRDALGNVYPAQLCPANPDVRRYALALTDDIATHLKPDAFYLESLSYLPYNYGFLNPKVLTPITPRAEFLLSLCFCDHCVQAAAKGLDAARLRKDVATWLATELPRMPTEADKVPVNGDWLDTAFDSRMQHYLAARAEVASSLYEEVVKNIKSKGDIRIEGELVSRSGMPRTGLVPERINKITDRFGIGVPTTADDVKPKREALPEGKVLLANVQPAHVGSQEEIAKTVRQAREAGVDGFTFYNYGLVRIEQLQWIGEALAARR